MLLRLLYGQRTLSCDYHLGPRRTDYLRRLCSGSISLRDLLWLNLGGRDCELVGPGGYAARVMPLHPSTETPWRPRAPWDYYHTINCCSCPQDAHAPGQKALRRATGFPDVKVIDDAPCGSWGSRTTRACPASSNRLMTTSSSACREGPVNHITQLTKVCASTLASFVTSWRYMYVPCSHQQLSTTTRQSACRLREQRLYTVADRPQWAGTAVSKKLTRCFTPPRIIVADWTPTGILPSARDDSNNLVPTCTDWWTAGDQHLQSARRLQPNSLHITAVSPGARGARNWM